MVDQFEIYIWLIAIIIIAGVLAKKLPIPSALLLVMIGMLLSYIPSFPQVKVHEEFILNFFLPLLVYQSTSSISWEDIKFNKLPIALLSVGHVIFIAGLVAYVAHAMIPGLSWAAAVLIGAIVSPPDDVAIFSIAEKIRFPHRILAILSGESLLNDATALTLFRFSLAVLLTHQFVLVTAISQFFTIIIVETIYGFILGHVIGKLRTYINDPILQILFSFITPLLAYLPAVHLGGSGVLATVVTGLVIGHFYLDKFTAETRILWTAVWETIGFTLSSILFLLVGLHLRSTILNMAAISPQQLVLYGLGITSVIIIGRFLWVFPSAYLPKFLFPHLRKKDPYPPWQYAVIISWAGMRGGVSLAAALIIPSSMIIMSNTDLRDLATFLVFCVIIGTLLLQGLTLPWLMHAIGVNKLGNKELGQEHYQELFARSIMASSVLSWLHDYKSQIQDPILMEEVELQILTYKALKKRLEDWLNEYHQDDDFNPYTEHKATIQIYMQLIATERSALTKLWHEGKISFKVRNKLQELLDLRAKRYGGYG